MARKEREARHAQMVERTGGTEGSNHADGRSEPVAVGGGPKDFEALRAVACSALSELLLRTDGWLRIVPSEDGKAVYYKWKFTRGDHEGHYVMVVGTVGYWPENLIALGDKLAKVDHGLKRPVRDTWYDWTDKYTK